MPVNRGQSSAEYEETQGTFLILLGKHLQKTCVSESDHSYLDILLDIKKGESHHGNLPQRLPLHSNFYHRESGAHAKSFTHIVSLNHLSNLMWVIMLSSLFYREENVYRSFHFVIPKTEHLVSFIHVLTYLLSIEYFTTVLHIVGDTRMNQICSLTREVHRTVEKTVKYLSKPDFVREMDRLALTQKSHIEKRIWSSGLAR